MSQRTCPRITIIGAGLVGSLTATLLAQRGFAVEVFERRPDPRLHGFAGGLSINLALTERGLQPLRGAGLAASVLARAVPMRGRMVHPLRGTANLQLYGRGGNEVNNSVSRGGLNILLLDAAEHAGARLHFDLALTSADFEHAAITLTAADGQARSHAAGLLLGCDGAGSALRASMSRASDLGGRVEPLGHGYKELEIPGVSPLLRSAGTIPVSSPPSRRSREDLPAGRSGAAPAAHSRQDPPPRQPSPESGRAGHNDASQKADRTTAGGISASVRFALAPDVLHIWPRRQYMCIALPNTEGNFTVTLFLANAGGFPSFATLPDMRAARRFFEGQFPTVLARMPKFDRDWQKHPVGQLATLYLDHWHLDGRAVLLGDAAHAVVPFHGQGMNAGFEDAAELASLLAADAADTASTFAQFEAKRKPNADAIAAMSLANYIEMRDGVADPRYLLKRQLAAALTGRAPEYFMSRYRMVSFSSLPYATCVARDRRQNALMDSILAGRENLESIDLDAAATKVRAALSPLSAAS